MPNYRYRGRTITAEQGSSEHARAERLVSAGRYQRVGTSRGPQPDPQPAPASTEGPSAPPKAGRGSGREAWADYARQQGYEVSEDDTRDDLIAKVG